MTPAASIVSSSASAPQVRRLDGKGVVGVYARTTTVQAQPSAIEEGIRAMREDVLPRVQQMEGNVGLSMLADRSSGRCIVTAAWRDEQAMHDAADAVRPLRERMAEILGAPTTVQEWEIAVLHRRRPADAGACARVSWLQTAPGEVDGAIDVYRTQVLGGLDDLPGFCSASLLVERASGRSVSSVAYEDRDMLELSRQGAAALRSRTVQQLHAQVTEVAEFELVLSELRVPETV